MIQLPTNPRDRLKVLYALFGIRSQPANKKPLEAIEAMFRKNRERMVAEILQSSGVECDLKKGAVLLLDEVSKIISNLSDDIDRCEQDLKESRESDGRAQDQNFI